MYVNLFNVHVHVYTYYVEQTEVETFRNDICLGRLAR